MDLSPTLRHRSDDGVDNHSDPSSSRRKLAYDPVLRQLGSRIRLIRRELHLSLAECAARCEVDLAHISKVERGIANSSVMHLAKLANGLGVELVDLFKP
jgi:ribosome-binding protein aMBF1 (putative translation factor)